MWNVQDTWLKSACYKQPLKSSNSDDNAKKYENSLGIQMHNPLNYVLSDRPNSTLNFTHWSKTKFLYFPTASKNEKNEIPIFN